MSKSGFFLFLFLFTGALPGLLLSACGTAPVPEMPSFEKDIKPLTLSRCVRCHGAAGALHADPIAILNTAPTNGFFDQYDDPPGCTTPVTKEPCRGLHAYANGGPNQTRWMVYFPPGKPAMMPPAPGAQLTDRERELLDRWNANPQP